MDGEERSYQLHLHTKKCTGDFCVGRNRLLIPPCRLPFPDLCQIYYEGCSYSRILPDLTFAPTFPVNTRVKRYSSQSPMARQVHPRNPLPPNVVGPRFPALTSNWISTGPQISRLTTPRMPAQGMPAQRMPAQGMSAQRMPAQGMPVQRMPAQGMPVQRMPAQGMPVQRMAVQRMPAQGMPVQGMPVQRMPAQGMPVQGMPVQRMPAQGMPVQGMPVQRMPAQGMPVQGMPVQRMPAQGMPVQRMPAQGMPAQRMPRRYQRGQPVLSNCIICGYQFCRSWQLDYNLGELLYGKQQMCHSCYIRNEKLKPNSQYASEIVCFFNRILEEEQTLRNNTNFGHVQGTSFIQNVEIENFILKAGENYFGNLKLDSSLITSRRSELDRIADYTNFSHNAGSSNGLPEVTPRFRVREIQSNNAPNQPNASTSEPQVVEIPAPASESSSSMPGPSAPVAILRGQSTNATIEIKPHAPFPLGNWSTTRIVNLSVTNKSTDLKYNWGTSSVPINALHFLADNNLLDSNGGVRVNHGMTVQVTLKLVQGAVENFYAPNTFRFIEPDQNSPHHDLARFSLSWTRRMGANAENHIMIHERATDTLFQVEVPGGGIMRYNSLTQEELYEAFYQARPN